MKQETTTIKIDTAFIGQADDDLVFMLDNGYSIIDKTVMGDRYIYYILGRRKDTDVGKAKSSS